jgi:hypothetical protein
MMQRVRMDDRTVDAGGAAGTPHARFEQLSLERRSEHGLAREVDGAAWRKWLRRGARLLRNAAVAVALMALVPIAIVAVQGDRFARLLDGGNWNMHERVAIAERMRPLGLSNDPSITPMQAGLALSALQRQSTTAPGFEPIQVRVRPAFSWRSTTIAPDMFVSARPDLFAGPSSRSVLETAARGLSAREMEYLRALAASPGWREFDLVARAPAVDVVGGQFRIPFGDAATAERRPIPKFADARELAYAAVSRAAYHMAVGHRDSAETVLRSIVSFGFALIDNGPGMIDEMIGTVIVGIGRDALQRFYVIQHDRRASLPMLMPIPRVTTVNRTNGRGAPLSSDEVREQMLTRLADSRVPRGERFELTRALQLTSCTNVRDLVFGPRAEVLEAVEQARRVVPRYPSERALMDLQTRPLILAKGSVTRGPFQTLAVSAASVPGALLGNPRLEACALLLTGW